MSTNNTPPQLDDLQSLFDNQPQDQGKAIDVYYYIDLLLHRRWIVFASFFIAIIVGIYQAVTLPKIYQAETLILVEPQRVPDNFVRSIVPTDLSQQISTIKEMIMSRTNLLKIIEKFNLFNGPQYAGMFSDDKIEAIRKRTSVDIVSGSRTSNAFKIAFQGRDPHEIVQVVNAMAGLVIDQNLKVRESQAVGTVEFLEQEQAKCAADSRKSKPRSRISGRSIWASCRISWLQPEGARALAAAVE